jgi:hypothetical protein
METSGANRRILVIADNPAILRTSTLRYCINS